ncbi:IS3 family transposase [Acuticoccus sp. 2012]|uniref:IS3 family transposase n=1 Tax=Acuticoccus mangrovi TaxID=2796142 RepID=A0A934MNZ7_9HYPH|nr:IS3 family transposase [Acuticoccus mangrovi]
MLFWVRSSDHPPTVRRQTLYADIAVDALGMAIERQRPGPGLSHHGVQYAAEACRKVLAATGVIPSMNCGGNCLDNVLMESFFQTLVVERVHHQVYPTRDAVRHNLFGYIEGFHNPRRLRPALGHRSPVNCEHAGKARLQAVSPQLSAQPGQLQFHLGLWRQAWRACFAQAAKVVW